MKRLSINEINSEQLDDLYMRAEQLEELLGVAEETSNQSEAERARAVQRAEQAEAALERARQARRRMNSALIAVESHLTKPYPDDPRWTPWTRFVGPALQGLTEALQSGPPASETTARVFAALHRSAEQDVTRVIDLYEQWVKSGPPPLGTSISRWWDARLVELHDAILPPLRETGGQS